MCLICLLSALWGNTAYGYYSDIKEAAMVQHGQVEDGPWTLRVSLGKEGCTIDPAYVSESNPADYLYHLYEGLLKYVPADTASAETEMKLTEGLAERWEISEDGLTYRFYLREDAFWSDGVPVRASDFVYAWQRLVLRSADEGVPAVLKELAEVLEHGRQVAEGQLPQDMLGVTAEGEKVLSVRLGKPCAHFLKLCAHVSMVPVRRDLIELHGGDWTQTEYLVVSGAYCVEHWVHDEKMVLTKNPWYYDYEKLGPDAIEWSFPHTNAAEEQCDFTAIGCDDDVDAGTYYLYLNANGIGDWRVRAAMLLSVDRERLAALIGSGAVPAGGLVPQGLARSNGTAYALPQESTEQPMYRWLADQYPQFDLHTYEGRCALAVYLYEQALAAGSWYRSYRVEYRFNDSAVNRLAAEVCQSSWEEVLGLRAEFAVMDGAAYTKMLRTNTFDVAYLRWLPDYDDPFGFLEIMERGGAYNHSGWGDVRYNTRLEQITHERDETLRDELMVQADAMLFEEGAFAVCPLFYYGESYSVSENIVGIRHSAVGGYGFQYAKKQ